MHSVSQNYKSQIRKQLRNRTYMRVTVGVINQLAQTHTNVTNENDYLYLADFKKPFQNYDAENYYATAEEDFSTVDGEMYFAPSVGGPVALNQGIISKKLLGTFKVKFNHAYDFRGITVDFGAYYPIDFVVKTDSESFAVTGNDKSLVRFSQVMKETTTIAIIPSKMVGGQQRLRVRSFTCGIGITFDNKQITKSSLKQFVSPISEELPTTDFTLEIDNTGRVFDIENDKSTVHFLESGQTVTVDYGYTLDDNTVEWFTGATLRLDSWKADDERMSFTAVDIFPSITGTYDRGELHENGITLYDLAVDVLTSAGFEARNYEIDEYLKSVTVYNPIPVCTYADAIQLIANAGRCVVEQKSDGTISIKHSFAAQRLPDMSAIANEEHNLSTVNGITNSTPKAHYAMGDADLVSGATSFYFLPKDAKNKLATGFISKNAAKADGTFDKNPVVTVLFEASYKAYGLRMNFTGSPPKHVIFKSYMNGTLQATFEDDIASMEYSTDHEFAEFDKITMEFTKGSPNVHVLLDSVIFGDTTDYWLTYGRELTDYPQGTQTDIVKEIVQNMTIYSHTSDEAKQLYKQTVVYEKALTEHISLSNASYDVSVTVDGTAVTITNQSAFFVEFAVTPGTHEIIATGKEYDVTHASISYSLHTDGGTVEESNPLISTQQHALDVSEWEGDYYYSNREYDIKYRGDPRIEANDILFLENKYVNNLLIRVLDHQIDFNGSLSGTISARRDMAKDA